MAPLLLLTFSSALAAKGGSLNDLDKNGGFRGLAFGSDCTQVESFKANKGAQKGRTLRTKKSPYLGQMTYWNSADELVGDILLLDISTPATAMLRASACWLRPNTTEELLFTFTTASAPRRQTPTTAAGGGSPRRLP